MIGRTVSHFRIVEKLGEGGMGVVYKAEDTKLGRAVALKFLPPELTRDKAAKTRFMHEAQAASALQHNNICTIHEIDEFEGQSFIAMEFVEGRSLEDVIESGPLKLEQVRDIASQLATGLHHAHEKGIVHRDIKPANIIVTPGGLVKIMDFGLARAAGQTKLTREGTTVGTVAYMSPEQVRADAVDHRTDVWSLGVILYEMVSGQRPFKGDYDQVVMYSILNEEPPPLTSLRTGVPVELERMVTKALAKRPGERYQHADELLSDLRRLGSELSDAESKRASSRADTESGSAVAKAGASWKRRRIALPLSVLVVAGLAVAYFLLRPFITEQRLSASPRPIAVISFENFTGDPQFDYLSTAIPNLLITSLEQSGYLRVTTWERMRDLIKQLGKEETEIIDKELGFELCRRDGIDLIVTGSFTKAGNAFATDIKVLDVETKRLVRTASARGDGVESILRRQVDELSREISRGVGLSLPRIEATQRPVIDVTTTSMDAYSYFLRGRDEYERFYYNDAKRALQKAVQLDSTFAVAHLYLAFAYGGLLEPEAELASYKKAREYSSRATEKERLYIEAWYTNQVERNVTKSISLLGELVRKYPKEKSAHYDLARRYASAGRYEDAVKEYDRVLKLDPTYAPVFNALAYAYMHLRNCEGALEYFKRYSSLSPGDANPIDSMGDLYVLTGDLDSALVKYEEAATIKLDFSDSILKASYVCGVKGEYNNALSLIDRYIRTASSPLKRAGGYAMRATFLLLLGNPDKALEDARRGLELSISPTFPNGTAGINFVAVSVSYEAGHYDEARHFLDEFKVAWLKVAPESGNMTETYFKSIVGSIELKSGRPEAARKTMSELRRLVGLLVEGPAPLVREAHNIAALFEGELLLAEGKPREAIAAVSKRFKLESRVIASIPILVWNVPLDQDVVARSYVELGDLDRAIAEYRNLIEFNPKGKDRRLKNPRYHYRLAKLYEEKGRPEEARREYERFLLLWKNADTRLPEYVDATARLRKLRGSTAN